MRPTLLAALIAAPTFAQELPDVGSILAEIDGREVRASGAIGHDQTSSNPKFATFGPDGRPVAVYNATYALDRDALASLEPCALKDDIQPVCKADISAEIEIEGSSVRLIIFEIKNVQPL